MSSDGINRMHEFDRLVETAVQGETIGENYERLKAALHLAAASAPSAGDTSLPATHQYKFERELHFHAPGQAGRAPLLLHADSEADLDALEHSILGY